MFIKVFVWVLVIVSVFYFLVCADKHEAGFLSVLRRFFLETIPGFMRRIAVKIVGERIMQWFESVWDWMLYKPNPIVQIIYLLCAVGGFYTYVNYGFCHIPNNYVSSYHKVTGTIVMIACYFSYYKACVVSPGSLSLTTDSATAKNFADLFPYDGILYSE
jgi:hypothetical protein